jgi:superfamily I DNA/RNA helicase
MKEESESSRGDSLEYVNILRALMELPFNVGKNLLADFLVGEYKNKSIVSNKLDELHHFDSLNWDKDEIIREIDRLISNGMIELITSDYNRFVKVLRITIKGQNEIVKPTLPGKQLNRKIMFTESKVSEQDIVKFQKFKEFLEGFNDGQKKAIISEAKKILCVAGAGSGKTTVLTKRIEFLVRKKEVPPERILAITFTRKARQEMQKRLKHLGVEGVNVHTFNSFCENILRKHEAEIYGRKIRVQSYADRIIAVNMALANLGLDMKEAVDAYFTQKQRDNKNENQLANSFMNDCFSIMDYFKVTGEKEYDFSEDADSENRHNAKRIYQITKQLKSHMELYGLRDYTDQIVDGIKFLKQNPSEIPKFDYVLVDEYQDVNAMQIELISLLNPENLFAVGDPRQAIFGWRGSDIKFIINFEKDYGEAEVIHLTENYRSSRRIVEFMNHSIIDMGLPDLKSSKEVYDTKVALLEFPSENEEREFVIRKIMEAGLPGEEIFVLARTNRQLQELSQIMKQRGILHIVRTDEVMNPSETKEGHITLATVHAIKGLEAKLVFLIGANEQNFPCKASDHPVLELVKTTSYDREEEERRLFYVAISRAKEKLYLTYSGTKPTYFIVDEMLKICES